MIIHFATGYWLTIQSVLASRVFPFPRKKSLASFHNFASALNRWRRCSFFQSFIFPDTIFLRKELPRAGEKERSPIYEKRNYHQRYRYRNQNSDYRRQSVGGALC